MRAKPVRNYHQIWIPCVWQAKFVFCLGQGRRYTERQQKIHLFRLLFIFQYRASQNQLYCWYVFLSVKFPFNRCIFCNKFYYSSFLFYYRKNYIFKYKFCYIKLYKQSVRGNSKKDTGSILPLQCLCLHHKNSLILIFLHQIRPFQRHTSDLLKGLAYKISTGWPRNYRKSVL